MSKILHHQRMFSSSLSFAVESAQSLPPLGSITDTDRVSEEGGVMLEKPSVRTGFGPDSTPLHAMTPAISSSEMTQIILTKVRTSLFYFHFCNLDSSNSPNQNSMKSMIYLSYSLNPNFHHYISSLTHTLIHYSSPCLTLTLIHTLIHHSTPTSPIPYPSTSHSPQGDEEISSSESGSKFPLGATDVNGQQVDLRTHNSWTMRLHEVL